MACSLGCGRERRHSQQRHDLRESHGQPMVFAHGFGCDQNMWRFVAPAFEDRLPGGRASTTSGRRVRPRRVRPGEYSSLDGYADDVLEICAELDLHDVVFVGHSVSAMIGALGGHRSDPELFAKLVMVGPSPRYIDDDGYVGGFSRRRHRRAARLARQQLPRLVGGDGAGDHGQPRSARARRRADRELLPHRSRRSPGDFARVTFLSDNRADLGARARRRRWCCSAATM